MTYLLYFTALLNVLLGVFTFVNKPKLRQTFWFLLVSIGIAGWAISNAAFQESSTESEMYGWAIIAYQIAGTMLFFVQKFAYSVSQKRTGTLSKVISLSFLAFSILGPLVEGLVAKEVNFEKRSIVGGPLLPLLFISYLYLMFSALRSLYASQKGAVGIEKKQKRYVFLGLTGAVIAGTLTNLVLPSFEVYDAVAFGPTFTLILLSLISYAIIRHRLFDVRVLVGRITYYSFLTILPYSMFFVLVITYTQLFGTVFHPTVYFLSIFVGVAFVLLFNWTNNFLRTQVDSRLINPGYNPLETVEELSNNLSVMIDLPLIIERVQATLNRTIRPDYSTIVIYADDNHAEDRIFHSVEREATDIAKLHQAATLLWSSVGKHPIVQDEIDIEIEEGLYRNTSNIATEVKQLMLANGAKVLLTLGDKDNIIGMILIGQKEADSPYTTSDLDFLKSIANTSGLAIQRSLLYDEVKEFANTLQGKVDKATAELKKTNVDLESALTQLQEARRVERDMVDVMGHELRTPISIVRNALVMLHKQQEKNSLEKSDLDKYLDMALESTRREITLIETLLTATKVDAARMQLYLEKADFKDVVNDAIEGQRHQITEKGLEIKYDPPAEDIFVYTDRTRVQEVMDNFLSNAVKYTQAGTIELKIWQDENNGWISVKDSGIGIAADDLQKLGRKFFRARQYISSGDNQKDEEARRVVRPGGTGLGLYVTFDLIGVMNGQLYITSEVGKGSTFTFSMPIFKNQEPQQVDQTFDPQSRDQKQHIFIGEQPS